MEVNFIKEIASYTYEIIPYVGMLLTGATETEKYYFASNTAGEVQIRVTVMDASGNTAKETLTIYVMENGNQKISDTEGGFGGVLDTYDSFGWAISNIGDLDSNGILDLVCWSFRG